jgi:hypothetical protein
LNKKKNFGLVFLFLTILISIQLIKDYPSGTSTSKIESKINNKNNSSVKFLSTSKTKSINTIQISQNYSYNLTWENSQIILTESVSFNSSTDLLIKNCTIFFDPTIPNSHMEIIIGEMSRLNITDSSLVVSSGSGSISFYGTEVHISNSIVIGLGESNYFPGLYLRSRFISINDSRFISGFNGLVFSDSTNVKIRNCTFQDINGFGGYGGQGIVGFNSNNVNITSCSFLNTRVGIEFQNCQLILISDVYIDGGIWGINIYPNWLYSEVYNIWVVNSSFNNLAIGIGIIGTGINVSNNIFLNLRYAGLYIGGRDIFVKSNVFQNSTVGIMTPDSLPSQDPNQIVTSSISDVYIQNNLFTNISDQCILITNYEYPTVFLIAENNFTNIRIGIGFVGNLGGRNTVERSWVIGNTFDNITEYAIEGSSLDYLAHFQYTSFIQNAFMNSSNELYTSFQSRYYYMDDVRWDDDFVGNYWESFVDSQVQDEDKNLIGDNLYIISQDHGQFDQAPLLSLDFMQKNRTIISNHPTDLVRATSELKGENATLQWTIRADNSSIVAVYLDGKLTQIEKNDSIIEISLLSLSHGLHNYSLVILTEDQIYRDTVWVRILKDDANILKDVLVPFGAGVFVIAIITVFIFSIKKRYS